jgi:hypothetical protein
MASSGQKFHLGFLSVIEIPGAGYVGGLLVTNQMGRPLEFQCTTPVRPNRTQEILYGPTLRPFLLSDLIGKTLFERLAVKPQAIVVSDADFLSLRPHLSIPVACVSEKETAATPIKLGQQWVQLHSEHAEADVADLKETAKVIVAECDLREPIARVRDALEETLRAVTAA